MAKIGFHTDGGATPAFPKAKIREWIDYVVHNEGFRFGNINYIFCSPARHLEINRHFLGHDWPTDVITFDYSAGGVVGGDIFIDYQTVTANARDLCVSPAVELRRVMVHGVLHLCGLGDKTAKQRRVMRAREDFYLNRFYAKA